MKKPFSLEDKEYIERIETRLSYTTLVDTFTPPEGDDIVVMGSFSRTWRNKKRREIKRGHTEILGDRVDSPIAHTRDYLMTCYKRKPSKKGQKLLLFQKQMPIHVYPCLMEDASYVDVKGAWWNIMLSVGWNCEYNPGRWLGYGQPPDDFPLPHNKIARSAMVTIARSGTIPVWRKGKIYHEKLYNRIENLHIWGIIADVLHTIAVFAVEYCECRYVATDGFITPSRCASQLVDFINGLGLETRIKWTGACMVAGAGSYKHNGWNNLRSPSFRPISNLDYDLDFNWIVKKYTYCNLHNKMLQ